jgi:hypothetical protein
MINSLIYYEKYEIYLNYGILDINDYEIVKKFITFLEPHVSSMFPRLVNFNLFNQILYNYNPPDPHECLNLNRIIKYLYYFSF